MNPPFARGSARYLILGTSNTGKTTLAVRLVKQILNNDKDPHQQLVIVSPNYDEDEKLHNLSHFAAQRAMSVRVYKSFDKQSMIKFVEYMKACAKERMRSVVFIDDPVGAGSFTSNVNQHSPFNAFVTGIKFFYTDLVFSTQVSKALSASARKNIDVFIYLPDMISRKELYECCRFVPTFFDFDRLMDKYASQSYHALWVNVQFGRKGVYCIDSQGQISSITSVPL